VALRQILALFLIVVRSGNSKCPGKEAVYLVTSAPIAVRSHMQRHCCKCHPAAVLFACFVNCESTLKVVKMKIVS